MQLAASDRPRARSWLSLALLTAGLAGVGALTCARRAAPLKASAPPADVTALGAPVDPRGPLPLAPGCPPYAPPSPMAALGIEVVASSTRVAAGAEIPLTFYVVNRSDRSVPVIRSLDASDYGWRYPKIDIEIRDSSCAVVPAAPHGRCGMVNELSAQDFVSLAPGRRVELFGEGTFGHHRLSKYGNNLAPGKYTVTLRYDLSFAADDPNVPVALRAKVATLPRGVYTSTPIEIVVE